MKPITQEQWCGERRCLFAIFDDGCFDFCSKGHDELPLNEDGDIECEDYEEGYPDDYEEDTYEGRELE